MTQQHINGSSRRLKTNCSRSTFSTRLSCAQNIFLLHFIGRFETKSEYIRSHRYLSITTAKVFATHLVQCTNWHWCRCCCCVEVLKIHFVWYWQLLNVQRLCSNLFYLLETTAGFAGFAAFDRTMSRWKYVFFFFFNFFFVLFSLFISGGSFSVN